MLGAKHGHVGLHDVAVAEHDVQRRDHPAAGGLDRLQQRRAEQHRGPLMSIDGRRGHDQLPADELALESVVGEPLQVGPGESGRCGLGHRLPPADMIAR